MTYVDVIVYAKYTGRRYYTYKTGLNLSIGSVVKAPYGKSSYPGIVMNIVKKPTIDIKDIDTIYDFNLPNQSVELLKWLCSYYPFDYGEICGLFIPPNLTVKPRVQKDTPFTSFESKEPFMLNKEQLLAVNAIVNNAHSILHGDTGTGKTETYLEVAKQMINAGKSVLIITPEIGLTPQLLASVTNRLKCPVYITNSQMTPAKRKQTWIAAYNNTSPSVYIGPRSSIFLPYQNLGLIVADESHDLSYYNQQNPRYNGLFVASQLAKIHKAHFVQSSATPNISDYYYCQKLKLPIIRMTKMAVGDPNVRGEVIDMTDKQNLSPYQQLSNKLLKELDSNLNNNMQSMLFINRRGTARIIQCQNCGHISQCPTCNLPLTYHHDQYKNKCHQCGYQESTQTQCSQCNSPELSYKTPGTKGTVSDIQKLFPSAKIARFDLDVQHSQSLKEQFENIKDGKFDIIIGTQLITKGLDLPKLSLVGILNADATMQLPDYHAEERTFQQLYQVSGRVGRGHSPNNLFIIQSYQPKHPVIRAALKRDWYDFYKYELAKRRSYNYPPYSFLAIAKITTAKPQTAKTSADTLVSKLINKNISILGPSPAYYEHTGQGYTWQILIKSSSRSRLLKVLSEIPNNWHVDIDPSSTL